MDRVGANFDKSFETIEKQLTGNPVAIHYPVGSESDFKGLIDLLQMKAILWNSDKADDEPVIEDIPDSLMDDALLAREELIEKIAETDDKVMELFLEGKELELGQLKSALRKATCSCKIIPVLCGSAFKNKGVQTLLDCVVDFLPSPTDIHEVKGFSADDKEEVLVRERSNKAPLSLLAFKLATDSFLGQLIYVRLYSGELKTGQVVLNSRTHKKERVLKIFRMEANQRKEVKLASAGDIVAIDGPKNLVTGDTLCELKSPIRFESVVFPQPVIYSAIEPKSSVDSEKLMKALNLLKKRGSFF